MGEWTISVGFPESCGGCGRTFDVDEPMYLATRKKLKRCADHAPVPVDHERIESLLAAVVERREEEDIRKNRDAAERAARGMTPLLETPAPRRRPPAPTRGFTKVADAAGDVFDPKAAAANDRD